MHKCSCIYQHLVQFQAFSLMDMSIGVLNHPSCKNHTLRALLTSSGCFSSNELKTVTNQYDQKIHLHFDFPPNLSKLSHLRHPSTAIISVTVLLNLSKRFPLVFKERYLSFCSNVSLIYLISNYITYIQ